MCQSDNDCQGDYPICRTDTGACVGMVNLMYYTWHWILSHTVNPYTPFQNGFPQKVETQALECPFEA